MVPKRLAIALVLAGLPAFATTPAPTLTAQDVVHHWIDAVGGARAVRKSRGVAVHAEAVDAGISARCEVLLDGDRWRRVDTEGARVREGVCADSVCWQKDWNGKVQELQGRDRRDRRAAAAIAGLLFGDALARIAKSGDVVLAGSDDSSSIVLRFTAADRTPFDVFLDKATSLPTKVVRKPYDDKISLQLSDWRTVKGRKVPFALKTTEGDTESKLVLRDVVPGDLEKPSVIHRPEDGAKDYRFAEGRAAMSIPFNFENDHIMVIGRVNGHRALWFLLDTGAEATIVNKTRLEEMGLVGFGASTTQGGGNATDVQYADVASLAIGDAEILNQRNAVIDLSGLEKIYGKPMAGLLGYDFISRFVVRVDYGRKMIDLFEPSDYDYAGSGTKVPFILEGGQPHVASTLTVGAEPPIAADFILDAGAADNVNLTSPFVKAHRLLDLARKKPADGPNTMAGSEKEFFAQTSVRGRLSSLTLGAFSLKDLPCNLMVGTKGAYASESISGTIGQGVLHRFTNIYDYARNVVILEPNADAGKPFPPRKTFGATILSDGPDYHRFTVTAVRKDSPAEAAGLRKDDVIAAVDDIPATRLTLGEVRKLLATEDVLRKIELQRGQDRVKVEVKVKTVSLDEE